LVAEAWKEDEGMYTCIAENQFGIRESSAFVSVTGVGQEMK
jgi:hypothetical protein